MLEEKIQRIRQIGEMALKGMKDEEIAKKLNMRVHHVKGIRHGLGIRRIYREPITESYRLSRQNPNTTSHYLGFTLQNPLLIKLGLNPKKQFQFIGKIQGKTLVLSFKSI